MNFSRFSGPIVLRVLPLLLAAVLSVPPLAAQTDAAAISGLVTDPSGAPVPGASIALKSVERGTVTRVSTNDAGLYSLPTVQAGQYQLTVVKTGFRQVDLLGVVVNVQNHLQQNFNLQVGSVSESVTVEGREDVVNAQSPAVGTTFNRAFVENLPMSGRTFQSLIGLTPGVVFTKASSTNMGQFSVNGQRPDANYFMIDGVSANIGHSSSLGIISGSGGSVPGMSSFGGTNNLISIDAMQEFRIQTSTYAPEFGRSPGGQISIVSRGGTNEFHGSVFEYFRNDKLDANDWFANSRRIARLPLRVNNFGGVVGGPVIRNKTFFFFSQESHRVRFPTVGIVSVPSLETRRSAVASVRPFFDAYPLPTGPSLASGYAEFVGGFSNSTPLDATSFRVDHTLNSKITLFGRYNQSPSDQVSRTLVLSPVRYTETRTKTLTGGVNILLSPRIISDLRANFSRNKLNNYVELSDFGGAVPLPSALLSVPWAPLAETQFQFALDFPVNIVSGLTARHAQQQFNIVENLSWVAGAHQLKFGVDYRQLTPTYNPNRYSLNYFTGSLASATRGISNSTSISYSEGPFHPVFNNLSLFAQDTWRATSRLNFTYGIRWELSPAPYEADGKDPYLVINIDNPAQAKLGPRGTRFYPTRYNNFAPRAGLAYQLRQPGSWQTVLRAGFGLFHDLGNGDSGGTFGGYPFTNSTSVLNGPVPLSFGNVDKPVLKANPLEPPIGNLVQAFEPGFNLPYTWQWNVAVEQALGAHQSITASYVAALGRRMLRRDVVNRPNNDFSGAVFVTRGAATSDYHALQLQFQRRLHRGFQIMSAYTWGKSLDSASNNTDVSVSPTILPPGANRGPSDFDIRHTFQFAATWTPKMTGGAPTLRMLANGWSLDMIASARSATPVNVITGRDVLNSGYPSTTTSRPDVLAGVPVYLDNPNVGGGRQFNRAAFVIPVNRQGSLGRNVLRGFATNQADLALRRQFRLSDRFSLQLRAEMFNVLNRANFGDPPGSLADPNFGISTLMQGRSLSGGTGGLSPTYQIGGPRSTQIAAKFVF